MEDGVRAPLPFSIGLFTSLLLLVVDVCLLFCSWYFWIDSSSSALLISRSNCGVGPPAPEQKSMKV